MKINNFRGDLTDISAKKEALGIRKAKSLDVVARRVERISTRDPGSEVFKIKLFYMWIL